MTSMEDVLLAAVFMFGLIGLPSVAVAVATMFKRWIALKEKQLAVTAELSGAAIERRLASVDELSVRVQVLERIVTDGRTRLAAEIEDLREPRAN